MIKKATPYVTVVLGPTITGPATITYEAVKELSAWYKRQTGTTKVYPVSPAPPKSPVPKRSNVSDLKSPYLKRSDAVGDFDAI